MLHGMILVKVESTWKTGIESQRLSCGCLVAGLLANKINGSGSHPSTEMAHRQSGGYKEEPGVAVAGDHVSVQLFNQLL